MMTFLVPEDGNFHNHPDQLALAEYSDVCHARLFDSPAPGGPAFARSLGYGSALGDARRLVDRPEDIFEFANWSGMIQVGSIRGRISRQGRRFNTTRLRKSALHPVCQHPGVTGLEPGAAAPSRPPSDVLFRLGTGRNFSCYSTFDWPVYMFRSVFQTSEKKSFPRCSWPRSARVYTVSPWDQGETGGTPLIRSASADREARPCAAVRPDRIQLQAAAAMAARRRIVL